MASLYLVLWCLPLLLLAITPPGRFFYFFVLLAIITRLSILLDANFIGDVRNSYIHSTENFDQFLFEPGYVYLLKLIGTITITPSQTIYFVQIIILAFLISVAVFLRSRKNEALLVICIALTSGFVFLATQNALRQGVAAGALVLSFYFINNKKKVPGLIALLIAQSFHFSSIAFFMVFLISNVSLIALNRIINIRKLYITCVVALFVSVVTYLMSTLFFEYVYIAGRNNDRFVGYLKPLMVLLYFMVTTLLFNRLERTEHGLTFDPSNYYYRLIFYGLFFGLSVNIVLVEVASRILFFCYALDLFYLLSFRIVRGYGRHLKIWIVINLVWMANPSALGLLIQKV